jgi:hypothetical protein
MVDGGSYIVALICLAPGGGSGEAGGGAVDLASVKLRAVQVRHVFGQLHQAAADDMQAQHEVEAEEMLRSCGLAPLLPPSLNKKMKEQPLDTRRCFRRRRHGCVSVPSAPQYLLYCL